MAILELSQVADTVGVFFPAILGDRTENLIAQLVSRQHRFDDPFEFGHELAVVDVIRALPDRTLIRHNSASS